MHCISCVYHRRDNAEVGSGPQLVTFHAANHKPVYQCMIHVHCCSPTSLCFFGLSFSFSLQPHPQPSDSVWDTQFVGESGVWSRVCYWAVG